jgi:hypothetical protein
MRKPPKPLPPPILFPLPSNEGKTHLGTYPGKHLGKPLSSAQPSPPPHRCLHFGNVKWLPEQILNPHGILIGTSGARKSTLFRNIALQLHQTYPSQVIVIDFHGDLAMAGEAYYRLDALSQWGWNLLAFPAIAEAGGWKLHALSVVELFKKTLVMGINQQGLLLDILKTCYHNQGITEHPETWNNPPPSMAHVEQMLLERTQGGCKDSKKLNFKFATLFQSTIYSKPSPPLHQDKLIRLDISKLPQFLATATAESIARHLYLSHKLRGESRSSVPYTFLMVDEAKEMLRPGMSDAIAQDGRKFGLGLWMATQSLRHLSSEVLANSSTKVILPIDASELRRTATRLNVSAEHLAALSPGQALLRITKDVHLVSL